MALVLSEKVTRRLIGMPRAISVVEGIFRDRAAGKVQILPRRRLKSSRKQLNVMAAWHAGWDLLCLRAYAMPTNTITLYDGRTGTMRAIIMNATYLSSLRTGAASGVAAKYLAPEGPEVVGLIGPGWQGTFQIEAIVAACPVREILVFGRSPKKSREFIRQMGRRVKALFTEISDIEEVEARSDVLMLATDSTSPLIDGSRIKNEALIISMGANQSIKHEVSAELIGRMDLIVTDDLSTAQTDSGDLISAERAGIIRWDDVIPLEKIVAEGATKPRPKKILFQSNGIADEDLAVARYVVDQVGRKKIKVRNVPQI